MTFAVCSVPVAPLRKDPAHRSEMVSQLLFGEFAHVLSGEGDFLRIRCAYDDYEGWCQKTQLHFTGSNEPVDTHTFCGTFHAEVMVENQALHIPFGAPIYSDSTADTIFGNERVVYAHPLEEALHMGEVPSKQNLRTSAYRFLNTGYLWGGKSVFGTDCSGFVQQVFKLCGLRLRRDAYQQAEGGMIVDAVQDAVLGDLAFFHDEAGRVTHVGIVLEERKIIHASGRVRIDRLEEKGIITAEGTHSHHLHSIRRYW